MHLQQATKTKSLLRPARPAARPAAPAHQHARWMDLQRGIGNQAISRLLHRRADAGASAQMQPAAAQLRIGAPGDAHEREADRVADRVAASPHRPAGSARNAPPLVQRAATGSSGQPGPLPASVGHALAGAGTPLAPALRQDMELRLAHDFSHVRVHTDEAAAQSARDVAAHAYTVGRDVVFGAGRFAPQTQAGRQLIAHELTHVVQQAEGGALHLQRQVISHTENPSRSRFSDRLAGLGHSPDYRIATFQVTEADLSDPKMTAGLRALSDDQLRAYLERTTDEAVRSYILGILATPEFADPASSPPPRLLTSAAATAAAADVNGRYDEDSIRTLESYAGQTPDGVFDADDAQALARLQQALGLTPNGKADEALLNAFLKMVGPTAAARSALIHLVVNRARLDTSAALAVVYVPGPDDTSDIDTFPGGVSTIQIGDKGFKSYSVMVAEIRKQLAVAPAVSPGTPVAATVLADAARQQQAIAANMKRLKDPRSIRLLQGALDSSVTGQWDVDLVRHIAARQQTLGRTPDGILDETTFAAIGTEMIAAGSQDPVLQLIVDYYGFDRSHAFNIVFDPNAPNATDQAQTLRIGLAVGTPGVVHVYPHGFEQSFAGLVHTVAHELGHIQQVIQGIDSLNVREFLSRDIEIETKGMRAEAIESEADIDLMLQDQAPAHPGFIQDAQAMLHWWGLMTADERRTYHRRFVQLRTIIINRIVVEGSKGQQRRLGPFVVRLYDADAGVP
jgi:peptidoglycan hydrolase-like protein with peptidoglycan-binding domain